MTRVATSPRAEPGFTLLEMVVVLVLVGIASAAIFPAISSMTRSSARSAAMSGASGDGRTAERLIEHDLRGAAGSRSMGDRSDVTGPTTSVVQALDSSTAALHDVLVATPTRLSVNTEAAVTSAGIEQVTWALQADQAMCGERGRDGHNWCVTRVVVGAAGTTSEVVTRGRGAFPATVPGSPCTGGAARLFCYQVAEANSYVWNAGWRADGCRTRWASLSSTFGAGGWISPVRHGGFDGQVQLHQLDLITAVAVTIPSGGGFGATAERTFNTTEVVLRSRQGVAYQRAIMCGGR